MSESSGEAAAHALGSLLADPATTLDTIQALLNTSTAVLVLADADGRVVATNHALTRMFNLSPERLLNHPLDVLFDVVRQRVEAPALFDRLLARLQDEVKAGHPPPEFDSDRLREYSLDFARPVKRTIHVFAGPILDKHDCLIGSLWSLSDVTDITRAGEQLRLLAEASPIPLIVTRVADGTILYANERMGAVVGVAPSGLIGQKSPDFYWDSSERQSVLDRLAQKQDVSGLEVRIRHANGEMRWTLFSLVQTALFGEPVIIGGLYDISDRKQTEEALRRSEERFRSYVENASDVIFACNMDGMFSYVSPNLKEYVGFAGEELLGRRYTDFVLKEDVQKLRDVFDRTVVSVGQQEAIEYRVPHKDGGFRWFSSRMTPQRDAAGQVVGVIGAAFDIHDKKLALDELERKNRELSQAQAKLVQSEKMASLGMLVAGIAHEINTPIGAVSSMHDTLIRAVEKLKQLLATELPEDYTKHPKFAQVLKYIEDANRVIKDGSTRVTTIVRRLRSFARLDEAELKLADIHEGLEDTLTLVHHELKHHIKVTRDFGELPVINCYPSRLNQVWLNLLMNAKQAMRGDGEITIRTWAEGNKVYVSVRDTGDGIPPENLARIFDPGFTTKGVGVGTGLGLSICYRIIEEHKGEIAVKSAPGEGTEFVVSIPADLS